MDDCLVHSPNRELHPQSGGNARDLSPVQAVRESSRCEFGRPGQELGFLGRRRHVSQAGVSVDLRKVQSVTDIEWATPALCTEVLHFTGCRGHTWSNAARNGGCRGLVFTAGTSVFRCGPAGLYMSEICRPDRDCNSKAAAAVAGQRRGEPLAVPRIDASGMAVQVTARQSSLTVTARSSRPGTRACSTRKAKQNSPTRSPSRSS